MPFFPGSYPAKVVADGASYYWRLDEPSGTTAVDAIGGVNGTISGGVTLNQPGALSDGDKGMTFDGVDDKILTAASVTLAPTFSVEAWIKTTVQTERAYFTTAADTFLCGVTSGKTFTYLHGEGTVGVATVADGQWHHVVIVLGVNPVTYYVDGQVDKTATLVGALATTTAAAQIGHRSGNNSFWNGSLDDVALYPSALTAAQVSAHYLAGKSSQSWPGVPWWIQIQGGDILDSFNIWQPITPSDTVDLPRGVSGGVWVGVGGDVAAVMGNNIMPVVLAAVPTGAWLPIAAKRINSTGTTASGLVALYEV